MPAKTIFLQFLSMTIRFLLYMAILAVLLKLIPALFPATASSIPLLSVLGFLVILMLICP